MGNFELRHFFFNFVFVEFNKITKEGKKKKKISFRDIYILSDSKRIVYIVSWQGQSIEDRLGGQPYPDSKNHAKRV